MANLMLTTACNFRCPYCFGLDMIGPGHPSNHMTWETFLGIVDWIDASGIRNGVHLMGGEPTLSPIFPACFRELRKRDHEVVVFSNAATPTDDRVFEESTELGVRWVVNTNAPNTYSGDQLGNLKRRLGLLGGQAGLTFNIVSRDTPYDYIFQYIQEYGLQKVVKIGVALPTREHNNVFVGRDSFAEVGNRVMEIHEFAARQGVKLEFECGVPLCVFSPTQRKALNGIHISHCGSRLDFTPHGEAINCLPLCTVIRVPYTRFQHYGAAREWFTRALTPYYTMGSSAECLTCPDHLNGACMACLAYGIDQYNQIALPPLPDKR